MNSMSSQMKGRTWVLYVGILCIILGMLLAASLKTQRTFRREMGSTRVPVLAERLRDQELVNNELKKEIEAQRREINRYEKRLSAGNFASEELNQKMQNLQFLAGLKTAEGPGVVVTLQDSKDRPANASVEESELFMVHDSDIRNVVNELQGAGAEVIAVNGQRLISRTAIRCSGNVTVINYSKVAAPFKVEAIGDPTTLENALKIPRGVAEELGALGMIKIEKTKRIRVKGYNGPIQFEYAKQAGDGS